MSAYLMVEDPGIRHDLDTLEDNHRALNGEFQNTTH